MATSVAAFNRPQFKDRISIAILQAVCKILAALDITDDLRQCLTAQDFLPCII